MARSLRVLVIEDNCDMLTLWKQFLRKPGILANFAESYQEALHLMETFQPDVILTDYHLPDGTALDILEKSRRQKQSIQVICLTGDSSPQIMQDLQQKGAEVFIKPVSFHALTQRLETALK